MDWEERFCTLCGPKAPKLTKFKANFKESELEADLLSARRSAESYHFKFSECVQCGMIFSDPAVDDDSLHSLYADTHVSYESLEEQIYDAYVPVLDKAIEKNPPRNRFVEIGGGKGFMLRYGKTKGFKELIEIDPAVEAYEKRPKDLDIRFVNKSFEKGLLPECSSSLICFFQTLDHVPHPRAFLAEVWRLLEPGGVAVCVVHDTSSLPVKVLGEKSPIFHLCHNYLFNKQNLPKLFESVGYANVDTFPIWNRYPLEYWNSLLPWPKKIRSLTQKSLNKLQLSQKKLKIKAGNLAVIAQKISV